MGLNVKAVLDACEKVCSEYKDTQNEGVKPELMIEAIRSAAGVSSVAGVRQVFRAFCDKHHDKYSLIKGKHGGFWNTKAYIREQGMRQAKAAIKLGTATVKGKSIAEQLADESMNVTTQERATSRVQFAAWRKAEIQKEVEKLQADLKKETEN